MHELPPVFVLAPNQLPDRRETCREHLAKRGLSATFFPALYGKDVKLSSGHTASRTAYNRMTSSVLSVCLSHWFLWQHVWMARLQAAIIFEDDIILPQKFRVFFHEHMAQTPPDWELVYMNILYPDRMADGRIKAKQVASQVWRCFGPKTWDGTCDGLHAYMLSLSGAEKLRDIRFCLDEPSDRWLSLNGVPNLVTYVWHPTSIQQRSQSDEWKSEVRK